MPQRKISRQEIIDAALRIVRNHGWPGLSARTVAKELRCSTMPIYSQFRSMSEIEEEVVKSIMGRLADYEAEAHTGALPLDRGIGYVLFAWEEPNLFAAVNDRRHVGMQVKYGDVQFEEHVKELSRNPRMKGLSIDQLRSLQFQAWVFIHGIASMKNWMDETQTGFGKEKLVELIRESLRSLTYGYVRRQAGSPPVRRQHDSKKVRPVKRRAAVKNGNLSSVPHTKP